MSKRSSESISESEAGPSKVAKGGFNEKVERVELKKSWRINNREVYRIQTICNNQTLDRTVCNQELFDRIKEGYSYNFAYQKINRLYTITDMQEAEEPKALIVDGLSESLFANSAIVQLKAKVLGAYEFKDPGNKNGFSSVKVILFFMYNRDYVQCDLIINLSCINYFGITQHDNNAERLTKVLKTCYEYLNEDVLVQASCRLSSVNSVKYCKLYMKENTEMVLCDRDNNDNDDDNEYYQTMVSNISYGNKLFKCFPIAKLQYENAEFMNKKSHKIEKMIKFTIEDDTDEKYSCVYFNNNNDCDEKLMALNNIDIMLSNDEKIYAVVNRRYEDNNKYILTAILSYSSEEDEEDFGTLFD
ncbi:lef-3 [Spodoptera litura granulovirus]|uniref:Lef-3 n=1 Tax=Spodoptera litura granulovirus TaxID=359919 RepID=A5IZV5_9BBAC|nr:lef-3 [Spodoptera litura granulovirus]ABQ52046.1 lef-3 [Spodoptera litura granulovirus]